MGDGIRFILNDSQVEHDLTSGAPVLDILRDTAGLKGTKEGCREGDCGACVVLVGERLGDHVTYRAVCSCLLPLGDLTNRHLVTIEGLNQPGLNPIQEAIVRQGATQCGFCTPGIVVALTGFFLASPHLDEQRAITAVEGNICRCTGYASICRAIADLCHDLGPRIEGEADRVAACVRHGIVPDSFLGVAEQLSQMSNARTFLESPRARRTVVAGGTDLYVQRLDDLFDAEPMLIMNRGLSGIREEHGRITLGATTTHEEMRCSPLIRELIPGIVSFTDLVSSQPIRQRATLGGNIVNASPIGDFTIILLALDAELEIASRRARRSVPLRSFFTGYKEMDLAEHEVIEWLHFNASQKPLAFNFEKVSKRTHLDIASVNSAFSVTTRDGQIVDAHLAAGGVAPIPLYLERTCELLRGRKISVETALDAVAVADEEIAPISDVRGSEAYKRLLLRQLILAHFEELFGLGDALVEELVG